MEMQNLMQQMSGMFSMNVSKDLLQGTTLTSTNSDKSFSTEMNKQMKKMDSSLGTDKAKMNDSVKTDNSVNASSVQNVNDARQQQLQTTDAGQNVSSIVEDEFEKLDPEIQEVIVSCYIQIQVQVSVCLQISPQELDATLDQMGLSLLDLQNLSNTQALVLRVSGEQSVTALLTNENLQNQVQDIFDMVNEMTKKLMEELQIFDSDFADLMGQMEESLMDVMKQFLPEEIISKDEAEATVANILKDTKECLKQEDTLEKPDKELPEALEKTKVPEAMVTEENISQVSKTAVYETTMETVNATMVETTSDNSSKEEKDDDVMLNQTVVKTFETQEKVKVEIDVSSEHQEFQQKEEKDTPLFEQLVDNISNAKVVQTENVQERVEVTQQMREIVEQVIETIKVTVTADTSEMSIQLNPENLGKVNLSVVAKEGHITAQFVTENEMAKHALEAQIQQLKETLTEQGLKVDKVEVGVSDFSFQQGGQASAEEQKENQRNEHAKQVHRSLNLADINDISDLTEEEELAVKIMRSNGGQVDYIA